MAENKLRILIIEDNPADARLIREMLKGCIDPYFEIAHAGTIASGAKYPSEKQCDVVVLDLDLPDSRGFEGLDTLSAKYPQLAIIVLTGLDDDNVGMEALKKGASDYLAKGRIDKTLLVRSLRYALERKRVQQALLRERANLQAIFDIVNTGMLLIDEKGNVKRVNNTVSKWVEVEVSSCDRLQPGDIIGCIHALSAPDGCGSSPHCSKCLIRKTFQSVLTTGKPAHDVEVRSTFYREGKQVHLWLEISADPLLLDGKRHVLLAMNNITARKEAEEVLKRDNDTLEKLVEEKSKGLIEASVAMEQSKRLSDLGMLASVVAHELRNPLAAIRLAAFNLKRKTTDRHDLDRHIGSIEIKTSESDQIINNLLFYSRLKSAHYERINPYDIVKEAFDNLKAAKKEKKFKLVNKFEGIKTTFIEADALQLKEVFANILNNAYDALSDKGASIEVGAKLQGDERIIFCIKDNGSGIDKENLDKVFEPFFSTKSKGTGLGLAVCRQIARLHKGDITIESKKGKGTKVSIVLPLKQPA